MFLSHLNSVNLQFPPRIYGFSVDIVKNQKYLQSLAHTHCSASPHVHPILQPNLQSSHGLLYPTGDVLSKGHLLPLAPRTPLQLRLVPFQLIVTRDSARSLHILSYIASGHLPPVLSEFELVLHEGYNSETQITNDLLRNT